MSQTRLQADTVATQLTGIFGLDDAAVISLILEGAIQLWKQCHASTGMKASPAVALANEYSEDNTYSPHLLRRARRGMKRSVNWHAPSHDASQADLNRATIACLDRIRLADETTVSACMSENPDHAVMLLGGPLD